MTQHSRNGQTPLKQITRSKKIPSQNNSPKSPTNENLTCFLATANLKALTQDQNPGNQGPTMGKALSNFTATEHLWPAGQTVLCVARGWQHLLHLHPHTASCSSQQPPSPGLVLREKRKMSPLFLYNDKAGLYKEEPNTDDSFPSHFYPTSREGVSTMRVKSMRATVKAFLGPSPRPQI